MKHISREFRIHEMIRKPEISGFYIFSKFNFAMMKKPFILFLSMLSITSFAQPKPLDIMNRIDRNMYSENRIVESEMTIHGQRGSRTIASRTYSVGDKQSFTEYLSPPRELGTKMLKLEDQLWIFSPSTDRVIQISGHMLRQSVMGSDLSYEDMMEDRKLTDLYTAELLGEELLDGRKTYLLGLKAKVNDIAYDSRKIWIDAERYVPLREDLFARSGQLLKQTTFSDVKQMDGRWFPTTFYFKDMLKQGKGTEFKITSIKFNQDIPEHIFSKAALRR